MAEYIPREALVHRLKNPYLFNITQRIFDIISEIPAADVAPVVHGRWDTGRFNLETGNYEEQCTHCRNFSKEYDKPYCPNCGAKMNGGADLEDD